MKILKSNFDNGGSRPSTMILQKTLAQLFHSQCHNFIRETDQLCNNSTKPSLGCAIGLLFFTSFKISIAFFDNKDAKKITANVTERDLPELQ